MKKILKWIFFITFIIFFMGCSSTPDIVTTDKEAAKKYSNAQTREIIIDQPTMLSGDYFRERSQQKPSINLSKLSSSEKKNITTDQKNLEKKVEQLEKELNSIKKKDDFKSPQSQEKLAQKNNVLKVKVGLLVDRNKILLANIEKLSLAASSLEPNMPLTLINTDEIYEALAKTSDIEKKDLYRTSGILTVYPGVRMLVLIETFKLPDFYPGTASANISIVDSGLFHRYQSMGIEMPINNNEDISKFVGGVLNSAFNKAVEASKIAPWFCRTFSREGDLFYINAGKKTGVKVGDFFKIIKGGKLVKSPDGIPAGWIPGSEKGLLKVDVLFGKDFAACSLVQGEKPDVKDILLK